MRVALAASLVAIAACSNAAEPIMKDAAALEAAGKLDEAATKLDAASVLASDSAREKARSHAAELRAKAAEDAIAAGHFEAAERILFAAMMSDVAEPRRRAHDRLSDPDFTNGLAFERATRLATKDETRAEMTKIADSKTPVAEKAKAWLAEDAPRALVAAALSACGADHKGSCSKAADELRKNGAKNADVDRALALADAEEKRIYPLRQQAERFLSQLAAHQAKEKSVEECLSHHDGSGAEMTEFMKQCREQVFGDETFDKRKTDANLYRRLLASIADPEIVGAIKKRQEQAEKEGVYAKLDIPKPKEAK